MFSTMSRLMPARTVAAALSGSEPLQGRSGSPGGGTEISSSVVPLPPLGSPAARVLDKDKDTPDSHVPRDPRLIRLTGIHPFNAEAPLTALYSEGFLTSVDLFYVRNHGPVPQVLDDEIWSWELSVEGLVEHPFTITLRQLVDEFEQITLPITLVCAGNRRKEQNTARQSRGFSWGAAGLSTALWTGPLMADLLRRAQPLRAAKYVCMDGADKLPNGYYGTSVKLNWALDRNKGIMLAHGMNGAPLRADHGRPLRVVVPGQIGGRSVKWLRRLVVTAAPSDNWYHRYDNKVLPTTITPEQSIAEPAWWRDDRYAIYGLNVNSVIVHPQHDEVLDARSHFGCYTVRGYAYSGGGLRVTRVEISIDSGKSWRLADVEYPEDKYREAEFDLFGGRLDMADRETCFCWCFWSYALPVHEMQDADSILVRAMDESMMCQPRDMYWSVLGMMNNPWFRVAIDKREGERSLRFAHPTSLRPGTTGWMERAKQAGGDLFNGHWGQMLSGTDVPATPPPKEVGMRNPTVSKVFTMAEFVKSNSAARPLFVVNGEIYDGTAYLQDHPGGVQSVLAVAGSDATEDFMAIHSETAKAMMRDFHIGSLDESASKELRKGKEAPSSTRAVFLEPWHWRKAMLKEKETVSHDVRRLTFELEDANQLVGLPVGHHLLLRVRDPATDESVIRAYTPCSDNNLPGSLQLLVKLYPPPMPGSPARRMTGLLDKVPLGTMLEFKGPVGMFEYLGRGRVVIGGVRRSVSCFTMICAGSGITPIWQVFRAVMNDTADTTFCTLLDGNRREEDILCRQELDALASRRPDSCKIVHALSSPPPAGWTGFHGRISEALLRAEAIPVPGGLALICGPPAMVKSIRELMLGMGWDEADLFFF